MTEYPLLTSACWLFSGIGLCILALALAERYATTKKEEEDDDD